MTGAAPPPSSPRWIGSRSRRCRRRRSRRGRRDSPRCPPTPTWEARERRGGGPGGILSAVLWTPTQMREVSRAVCCMLCVRVFQVRKKERFSFSHWWYGGKQRSCRRRHTRIATNKRNSPVRSTTLRQHCPNAETDAGGHAGPTLSKQAACETTQHGAARSTHQPVGATTAPFSGPFPGDAPASPANRRTPRDAPGAGTSEAAKILKVPPPPPPPPPPEAADAVVAVFDLSLGAARAIFSAPERDLMIVAQSEEVPADAAGRAWT